jgi:hypothetical protein
MIIQFHSEHGVKTYLRSTDAKRKPRIKVTKSAEARASHRDIATDSYARGGTYFFCGQSEA